MTISSTLNRTSLLGNGVTTTVPITFPFHNSADLVVLLVTIATGVQTAKTITTHYTVTSTPDALGHYPNGGTVEMVTAPATGEMVVVYRDPARTQSLDLVENDSLPANNLEAQFDYITMLIQRLSDQLGRTVRQPDGDSTALSAMPSKVDRASLYAAYDADGNPSVAAGTTSDIVATPFAETLLDDLNAAAMRTTLGVAAATGGTTTSQIMQSPIVTGIQGGTAIQRIRKTADESLNTSTTLQDDNHLVLAVDGLEEWVGEIHLAVGAALGDTGIKVAITVPSGATLQVTAIIAGDVLAKSVGLTTTTSGQQLDGTTTILAGCVNGVVTMHFWILNGATPGNLQLQWAQSTSHGSNVTVRKGSVLFAERVG